MNTEMSRDSILFPVEVLESKQMSIISTEGSG